MRKSSPSLLSLLALVALIASANAQLSSRFGLGGGDTTPKSELTAVAETTVLAPGGTSLIAVTIKHAPKYHSYYINPGLVGNPLSIDWTLPTGFTIERLGWPTPQVIEMLGLPTYSYKDSITHLFTVTAPAELPEGETLTISGSPTWQVCDDTTCVNQPAKNGAADFTLTYQSLAAGTAQPAPTTEVAEIIAKGRAALPAALEATDLSATEKAGVITFTATLPEGTTVDTDKVVFFDANSEIDAEVAQTITYDEAARAITVSVTRKALEDDQTPSSTVNGALSLGDKGPSFAISAPLKMPEPEPVDTSLGAIAGILGLLFLGGLILNLMPCVFPVIGLKIMGFVQQSGHDKRSVILHGVMFFVGVLISFWALAALLYFGGIANWGSQLENPYVILVLLVVMLLLALNMFGVFEIAMSATSVGGNVTNKDGLFGTFMSGVLATVIATPCAGPFLGGAIGAAVALPGFYFFLAFTAMAVGLGLPYLILSIFPDLVQKLPAPGPWMTSFKQGMSFLLFATVGVLVWIYSNQVFEQKNGLKGLMVMLGLAAIAFATWVYGRWSVPGKSTATQWKARILALVFLGGGIALAMPAKPEPNPWKTWSPEAQAQAIADGRPVFIDFTAKWCLTCQTNKATAYSKEVMELIKSGDVLLLKADKTNPDEQIDAELTKLGRSALPVNVLYTPTEPGPIITPEILTPGILKDLFNEKLPQE